MAHIGSHEILSETGEKTAEGSGICVGRPVDGAEVRVIRISDEPIASWNEVEVLPAGEIGEITVRGAMVTERYWARPERTALAKIDEGGQVVHRMGDVGYFDEEGRLWMCGRKDHRVRAVGGDLFTIPVERVFDRHESVRQSALVRSRRARR